jgi:hypothetical protein
MNFEKERKEAILMACKGHSKGGHSGSPKSKPKQKAGKACQIKLQKASKKKSDNKAMAAFIKKLRAK